MAKQKKSNSLPKPKEPALTVSALKAGLDILSAAYPDLWIKPVITIKEGYTNLECGGIKDLSKFSAEDIEALKALGWHCEKIKTHYYWYLTVPDNKRVKTW